jgi:hypothetical protein
LLKNKGTGKMWRTQPVTSLLADPLAQHLSRADAFFLLNALWAGFPILFPTFQFATVKLAGSQIIRDFNNKPGLKRLKN